MSGTSPGLKKKTEQYVCGRYRGSRQQHYRQNKRRASVDVGVLLQSTDEDKNQEVQFEMLAKETGLDSLIIFFSVLKVLR